jgi:HK97 family phage prohead protease
MSATTTPAPAEKDGRSFLPFEVKASDDAARTITGLAAAWSLDLGDDVIHKGAFARTLDHWRGSKAKRPIYLLDQHNSYSSVKHVLGKMTDASETDEGLVATFALVPDDPDADAAYKRVKGGFVTGLSIGYQAVRWEYVQKDNSTNSWDRIRHLHEVKLREVSLVVFPMNEDARIASAKSVEAITAALRAGTLTDDQKSELRALLAAPEAKAKAKFGKGDRVEALADHMEGMKGSAGKVTLVRNGPYYGVTFDGERKIHKWLAEDEITAASVDEDESGGSMAGMAHGKTRALPDGGLAPDDPQRVALEETLRAVTLRSLGTAA